MPVKVQVAPPEEEMEEMLDLSSAGKSQYRARFLRRDKNMEKYGGGVERKGGYDMVGRIG